MTASYFWPWPTMALLDAPDPGAKFWTLFEGPPSEDAEFCGFWVWPWPTVTLLEAPDPGAKF
jgi:hypothetical protein